MQATVPSPETAERSPNDRESVHACTRYVAVGGFTHPDASGLNRLHFTGRVGGHKLPPGNYQLTATPRSHGKAGTAVSTHFRILR